MRSRAWGAGNARELQVMEVLVAEGWLCASRRHIGGAGDILAIRGHHDPDEHEDWVQAALIEVKSTAGGPWERFGPADRKLLVELAEEHRAEAWLYWWPPRRNLQRIPSSEFPTRNAPQVSDGAPRVPEEETGASSPEPGPT